MSSPQLEDLLSPITTEVSFNGSMTVQSPYSRMHTLSELDQLAHNPSSCPAHQGSDTSDFSFDLFPAQSLGRWKDRWDEKVLVVRLKREGRDWDYIKRLFRRMGKPPKAQSAWTSMWRRSAHDIEILGRAARADREKEIARLGTLMSQYTMADAAWIDFEGIWERLSEFMDTPETEFKWTPDRVEYAWTHGVSNMFPDIDLRRRNFSLYAPADFVYHQPNEGQF